MPNHEIGLIGKFGQAIGRIQHCANSGVLSRLQVEMKVANEQGFIDRDLPRLTDFQQPRGIGLVRHIFTSQHFRELQTKALKDAVGGLTVVSCEDRWIDFKIAADFFGLMSQCVDVEYVSSIPLLGFRSLPLDDV